MEPNVQIIKSNTGSAHPYNVSNITWIERFARIMDSRFVIPGTRIRFGMDPILSLIPVVGDLITYVISGVMIYMMYTQGASRKVVIKMILNSTLDTVLGAIPVVGTVFDVFYRSNNRNVKLLKEYYFEGKHQGSGNGLLFIIIVVAILLVVSVIYGVWKLLEYLF